MALRFLQIFVPEESDVKIEKCLEGLDILGTWRDATMQDRVVIHLLAPAEETEPIMDRFEHEFGDAAGFHVILFPVEAVLPRARPKPDEDETPENKKEQATETMAGPGRVSREELYHDITETLGVTRVFMAMTILASIVAAVGLMRNDVAVIIGAMVIAPLLGPNVAMSLATTLGDLALLRHALMTNLVGITLTFAFSLMVGLTMSIDPSVPAIAARTQFGMGDLALALAAGSAGTFAFTRGMSGAVIGVMVAVALMPPLVTFGMLLGAGYVLPAIGALLLLAANVVGVNLAGVATFLAQGVKPRTWWEDERARKSTRIAIATWVLLLITLSVIVFVSETSESFGR